ncbi:hypothetical protein LL240_17355 [Oceanimonas baumannii]|uniref:hypothetical protein n=1 Tax=Oceanimonas baumannii TaxID=129578 RepID=UPI001D182370|nr:hypothetical protein [Oceanimonas baumannii]MCC4266202.1 hypothetical protein [Oceanimonas baumannii]
MRTPPKAGDKKSMLGLATEHFLAPLPVPTGRKPNNTMGMVWRINDTYMDVSDCTPGSTVATVHCLLVLMLAFFCLMVYIDGIEFLFGWLGFLTFVGFILPNFVVVLISIYAKPREPVRFNRQRREVCVPKEKGGDYWYVPWETVKASVEGFNMVSQAGVNKNGSLMIGFLNPNFNGEVKLGGNGFSTNENAERHLWFPNVVPEVGAGMWELIRTYMEEGPDKLTVHTDMFEMKNKSIFASYIEDIQYGIEKRGLAKGLLWEGGCGLFLFNLPLVDYIERKHLNPPPDLKGEKVKQWSKPLPKEQWARRSPELEQAIQEREAELAKQTAA